MRFHFALGLLIALFASADTSSALAASTRFVPANTVRHKPNVRTRDMPRSIPRARSDFLHLNYDNPDGPSGVSAGGYLWNGRSASEQGGD